MSWLQRNQAQCGRPIPKPQQKGKFEDEFNEDAIPLQDQIENLRTKISLKERYNKALRDDLNESNQGASSYMLELSRETRELREQLVDAIFSERQAVQNALRTHREFQLAMSNRTASLAIPWLDDKLFDMAKLLNCLIDKLKCKRQKLEEAEHLVTVIQKWPRPGTLPWEQEAVATFNKLECQIEEQKVKRETAFIIHSKYVDIKYQLLAERGKYTSLLKVMDSGLKILKNELNSLETMLDDAIYFRNETYKNLVLTEKEASENRKRRRMQMARMRKAVERILEENQRIGTQRPAKPKAREVVHRQSIINLAKSDVGLKRKKDEVEEFQDRAKRLVEVMRVKDLIRIPGRLKTVGTIGKRLREEQAAKERLRELLTLEKEQLRLILYYFRYTGASQYEEYMKLKSSYETGIKEAKQKNKDMIFEMDRLGQVKILMRLGMFSILDQLAEGKKKVPHRAQLDIFDPMKMVSNRLKKLTDAVAQLASNFNPDEPPQKNYAAYVKPTQHQHRLTRVGTPHVSEESEEDDDLMDSKVPTRQEIKTKSARFLNQANLKRGIRQ